MTRRITEKQIDVLRFTQDYINKNGSAPAVKEIAEGLGISTSLARDRIWHLFGHGCLVRPEPGHYLRSITLTEKGILACESKG
ncbi:MAG: LexA family protein [Planctomycetota bacterium]|jgi:SOS-response transcriptional repressor LexA